MARTSRILPSASDFLLRGPRTETGGAPRVCAPENFDKGGNSLFSDCSASKKGPAQRSGLINPGWLAEAAQIQARQNQRGGHHLDQLDPDPAMHLVSGLEGPLEAQPPGTGLRRRRGRGPGAPHASPRLELQLELLG
jgi:hypothetical protein